MHETAQHIIARLAQAFHAQGKDLYLVGGTVRDELLDRPSHDIDMATDARPEQIKEIAASTHPLHIVPIGEKFGTIQLHYAPGEGESGQGPEPIVIEVTTYRGERYTPGSRHPEVQFGTSLVEDLRRRDFTINAIAKDALTGEIVDPFYGVMDLLRGWICAVDDHPAARFADDPLRLLRAVRFAAQLDFGIAPSTYEVLQQMAEHVRQISQERIRAELSTMLLVPDPARALFLLSDSGLMGHILPEVEALRGVTQLPFHRQDVYGHTVLVVRAVPPRLTVRLAALLHDIAKPQTRTVDADGIAHFYGHEDVGAEMARAILRRLRFASSLVEHVATVVQLHMRMHAYRERWSVGAVRRLALDAGPCMPDLLDLALADGTSSDRRVPVAHAYARLNHLRQRLAQVEEEAQVHPLVCPLDGNELMALFGRGPGPWLRPLKQHLHDLVIEGALHADGREAAIAAARAFVAKQEQIV